MARRAIRRLSHEVLDCIPRRSPNVQSNRSDLSENRDDQGIMESTQYSYMRKKKVQIVMTFGNEDVFNEREMRLSFGWVRDNSAKRCIPVSQR